MYIHVHVHVAAFSSLIVRCTCVHVVDILMLLHAHSNGTSTSSDTRPSTSCRDNNTSMATTSAGFMEVGAVLPGGKSLPTAPGVELLSPVAR